MRSIMWKAINTLLKALERYAILTAGRQDLRKRGQPVNPWLKETGEKYLRGWDRRTTVILLGTSVLLTLYRFIGHRRVFTQLFGEFFFRGFMLFGLEKRFGNSSILIQTIPFVVKHASKPFAEAMGSIVTGVVLGVLALETRSFIYGAAVHWLVAMSMDILALAWK